MRQRILVVDDDRMNLLRTKKILENSYDVSLVESGRDALNLLKTKKVDLILLDIEMPGMNGIETFEHIRFEHIKNDSADVPVIFLTASGDEDNVLSAIKLGAVNYLKKPFYPQELLKRIAKELEDR